MKGIFITISILVSLCIPTVAYSQIPQSAINAWHKEYYKDAYGDYDYSKPYLVMSLDYSQDNSCIIGAFPDCFVISMYGAVVDYFLMSPDLYVSAKTSDGQVINFETSQPDNDTIATCMITEPESMRQFLELLREGNFRLVISSKPNSQGVIIPVKGKPSEYGKQCKRIFLNLLTFMRHGVNC